MKYVMFMCPTMKILISNWPWTRKFSQLLQAKETLYFGQNFTGEFMRKIYAASAEADRVLCQLVMFLTVFFDVQNEIQLLSGVFCYSLLVCLLGFWLRNTSLVKVGNPISDGIVFVFYLAWCVRPSHFFFSVYCRLTDQHFWHFQKK